MPGLDGLRALAIAAVVLDHSDPARFMGGGIVGVDLFFVLSGYLITKLLLGEYARTGTLSLRHFYLRRARRLLPALVLVLAFVAAVGLLGGFGGPRITLVSVGLAVTYSSNVARHAGVNVSPALAHMWTLALEEQFYLVWPAILLIGLHRLPRRSVLVGTVILIGLSFVVRYHEAAGGRPAVYYSPTTWADALLIGCLAAELDEWGYLARLRSSALAVLGLAPFTVILFALPRWQSLYQSWLLPLAIGNAAAIVVVAHNPPQLLTSRVARWVGTRSYGLYLWHTPVLVGMLAIVHGTGAHPQALVAVVAAAASVAVAAASYRFVERRWQRSAKQTLPSQLAIAVV